MTLQKLTPNHDLQCFFFEPSAIAALSGTSAGGFTVSGTFRQQFDWAVIEWNRDNVFEHPALRNLPDGDLSGITLSYLETRINCIAMDSNLFHTVSWPFLRVWAPDDSGVEQVYQVPIASYATPAAGSYGSAYADFTLSGTLTAGDFVGIAYLGSSITYPVGGWEGSVGGVLDRIVAAFADGAVATRDANGGHSAGYLPSWGEWESILGVLVRVLVDRGRVDTELGFRGADAGEWDVADAVAGDDTLQFALWVHRPGLFDPASDHASGSNSQIAVDVRGGSAGGGSYSRTEFQVVVSDWDRDGDRTLGTRWRGRGVCGSTITRRS